MMLIRSITIFFMTVLVPIGANAQADQETINMCLRTVCQAPNSDASTIGRTYYQCVNEGGGENCEELLYLFEQAGAACAASCTNDPLTAMGN
jgi:hypothetical protein